MSAEQTELTLAHLSPGLGARHPSKRRGRGIASGLGKTCGHGHKGQKSRAGGGVRPGFEGGQMPLQQRVPKFGFSSRKQRLTAEIRLHELAKVNAPVIDLTALKATKLIKHSIQHVKIIASGKLDKAVHLSGLKVTHGARAAIEAAGGKVEH
jgi:large subunit ribosomal protein L15